MFGPVLIVKPHVTNLLCNDHWASISHILTRIFFWERVMLEMNDSALPKKKRKTDFWIKQRQVCDELNGGHRAGRSSPSPVWMLCVFIAKNIIPLAI